MMMKDASAVAIQRPPDRAEQLSRQPAELICDAESVMALLVAADRLVSPAILVGDPISSSVA